MQIANQILEIFLQPGDYYFGDRDTRIRTILGSCVSVTMWHPKLLLGGMCHIMLPSRAGRAEQAVTESGKYADEAITLLLKEIKQAGTSPKDYQVKVFGGGNMFTHKVADKGMTIGQKNIQIITNLLHKHHFSIQAEHHGGSGHRYVVFDIWSGDVWVRHQKLAKAEHTVAAA